MQNSVEELIRKYSNITYEDESRTLYLFLEFLRKEGHTLNISRFDEIIDGILNDSVEVLKRNEIPEDRLTPILICVLKNEISRVERFFSHYRKLGIKRFVIVDNNSDDGSKEYCLAQPDADVFLIKREFSSPRHVAWVNKILNIYGRDRWYLSIDADELLDYLDSEEYCINQLVVNAKKHGITRLPALQVEFYANKALFSVPDNYIPWDEAVYFDANSYEIQDSNKCQWIVGGPRKRVLNTFSLLTKYALFYYGVNDVYISMHYLYPYNYNMNVPIALVLKHYEFFNTEDMNRMLEIIEKENYATKSKEYKEMYSAIEHRKNISFWHKDSVQYINSGSLKVIPLLVNYFENKD